MTDEIEIINIIHASVMLQRLQVYSALTEQVCNLSLLISLIPSANKVIKIGISIVDVLAGIVRYALCTKKFAVGIIYRHNFVDNFNCAAIFINNWLRRTFRLGFAYAHWFFLNLWIRLWCALYIIVVNFNWTIPVRVSKQTRHITKIHDCKMGLTFFFTDSGSTTHNLLKLCHGTNALVKYNEFNHFAIHSCREQFTCSGNDGVLGSDGNKVVKF